MTLAPATIDADIRQFQNRVGMPILKEPAREEDAEGTQRSRCLYLLDRAIGLSVALVIAFAS
jgi:hypothetical protein